jgi:hypothetical protein
MEIGMGGDEKASWIELFRRVVVDLRLVKVVGW